MRIPKLRYAVGESDCATSFGLFSCGSKKEFKNLFIKQNNLLLATIKSDRLGLIDRVLSLRYIKPRYKPRKLMLIDCITGTVYNPRNNRCCSSDALNIVKIAKSDKCAGILLSAHSLEGE